VSLAGESKVIFVQYFVFDFNFSFPFPGRIYISLRVYVLEVGHWQTDSWCRCKNTKRLHGVHLDTGWLAACVSVCHRRDGSGDRKLGTSVVFRDSKWTSIMYHDTDANAKYH